jgi:hypothetical protein
MHEQESGLEIQFFKELGEVVAMLRNSYRLIQGIILVAAMIFPMALASGQAATVEDDLQKKFKAVTMGSDTDGVSVVEEGTLLTVLRGGILAVPYSDSSDFKTKYQNGNIKAPGGLAVAGRKAIMGKFGSDQTTHLFKKGDKVYPTKVSVNMKKDTVTMGIVACDKCNKTDPPTYNKAEVVFVFPKGSLVDATAPSVEKVIAQVFTITPPMKKKPKGAKEAKEAEQPQQ